MLLFRVVPLSLRVLGLGFLYLPKYRKTRIAVSQLVILGLDVLLPNGLTVPVSCVDKCIGGYQLVTGRLYFCPPRVYISSSVLSVVDSS